MLAAYLLLDVSWEAASYGAADLDPAVVSFAFDLGNLGFANIGLTMGSFAVWCGWVVLSTRILGRWLGWGPSWRGVGLIWSGSPGPARSGSRRMHSSGLWVIIICIQLIRRKIALPEEAAA
jgi:hypothetical protein